MSESFASYVYRHILETEGIDEKELTQDEVATAEDALSLDDIDLYDDDLETMAHSYREQCTEQGTTPDFTGYEDYE